MVPQHIAERLQVFADARFRFEAKPHEYYLGEQQLTSFSRWIEQFVNPFVEAEAAPPYARKHDMSVEAVLALWEHNRWVGTQTHNYIEEFYRAEMENRVIACRVDNNEVWHRCEKFLNIQSGRLKEITPVTVEKPVWCEAKGICGTLDFGGLHPKREGILILDWKTNGSFSTNAKCYPKKMRGPFRDLLDNHENKYSLQNSFYRIILEEAGIPTAGGAMVHLPPGEAPAAIYPALDYRDRIRQLFL